jgi:hypothetical protein
MLLVTLSLLTTCRFNRVYHSRKHRYRIQYPEGWVAVNSNHDRDAEERMKNLITSSGGAETWKNVDVAFYNPESTGPVFQEISIKSVPFRMNINNVDLETVETMMTMELFQFFESVTPVLSDIRDFKRGKIIIFEFLCKSAGNSYSVSFTVMPGKLFGSYFIKSISEQSIESEMVQIRKKVLDSFKKY